MPERRHGYPFPKLVERYKPKRPSHADLEGQPQTGGINQPEIHPPKPLSFHEEMKLRMEKLGTDDPAELLVHELTPRITVLMEMTPEERSALPEQGKHWKEQRKTRGLTEDAIAEQVGISSWELFLLEHGFPSPHGIPEDAIIKINNLLASE